MSRDLTALAVVHLQPIEMDHVIQETNGVRHIQILRHYLFSNFLKNTFHRLFDSLKQKNCVCDDFEDKSMTLWIPIFCFT
jgi:hypothetical protein